MNNYQNICNDLKTLSNDCPNLANLWINYINLKKENYEKSLNKVRDIINMMKTNQNLSDINLEILKNLNILLIIDSL